MKGILANLLVKLGLDTKEFEKGIDNSKRKTDGFAKGMKAIGGMIAGMFAVSAISSFAKKIWDTGNLIIKLENSLAAAIRATGKDVESTMVSYKRFADEMENLTLVDAEVTLDMLRLAEAMRSKAPMEAAKNAIALSKALGIDLTQALKMAVMAQSDIYTMLGRYSTEIRLAGTETERTAAYTKLLASGMEIAKTEVESAAGQAKLVSNQWEALWESMALGIQRSNTLANVLQALNGYFKFYQSGEIPFFAKLIATFDITGNVFRKGLKHIKDVEEVLKQSGESADFFAKGMATVNSGVENKKYVKTIADLKEETAALEESLDSYTIKQGAEIQATLRQIEANKKLIESLTTLKTKREGIVGFDTMIKPVTELPKIGKGFGELSTGLDAGLEIDKLSGFSKDQIDKADKLQEEYLANWNAFKSDMAFMAVDFGTEVVDQLGAAFGELISTGDFPEDFGKNILAIIGGFISQLGKMLIGLGVASEAFQLLLKSAFTNPVSAGLAIAAGAALVMLGGALSSAAKAGPMGSGGGSGSGGYSVTSQPYSQTKSANGSNNQNGKLEIYGMLKGDSIYLSNQRNMYKRSVIG
jgi:hypothetical protein